MWFTKQRWQVAFVLLSLSLLGLNAGGQSGQTSGDISDLHDDDSDWWSTSQSAPLDVEQVEKGVAPGTLQIANISVGADFEEIAAKLGKAEVADRTFRSQACYVSANAGKKVYLIFELEDFGSNFYLFAGGPEWNGSNLCFKTKQISMRTHTASGLRLGLSPSRVKSILGPPDGVDGDRFVYKRAVWPHTFAAEVAQLRKKFPELSDRQARVALHDLRQYMDIDIRFTDSKLSYLSVSVSGAD